MAMFLCWLLFCSQCGQYVYSLTLYYVSVSVGLSVCRSYMSDCRTVGNCRSVGLSVCRLTDWQSLTCVTHLIGPASVGLCRTSVGLCRLTTVGLPVVGAVTENIDILPFQFDRSFVTLFKGGQWEVFRSVLIVKKYSRGQKLLLFL